LTFTPSGSKEHIPKCKCKIKSMIENTYGKHDSKNIKVFILLVIVLVQITKCHIYIEQFTTTKMEFKDLEGGAYMMKSMDIENHGNTCIESIVGNIHVANDKYSLFVSKHHMTQL
jgi:hypothetical protein